jgi:toxin-antitoxin system PIN domain toxin
MTCLPDVNVWIALAVGEHMHNAAARKWIDSVEDQIVFCRITQMGLLRLLTNQRVMGPDVLRATQAWAMFDAFLTDSRISRIGEPPGLDHHWRTSNIREKHGSNWWTDTYLAAFASAAGFTLVTFDTQLAARKNVRTRLLRQ